MKKSLLTVFAFACLIIAGIANAKSLTLYSKPVATSAAVATVESGARLIPIYSPEKSDWIKVADPSNGNVGWLKRQDMGLNQQQPQLYQKRIEKESGDKKKGSYRQEVYEYKGTEKLSDEQMKVMFNNMQRRQEQMKAAMQSMFNNIMNHFSDFDRLAPAGPLDLDRRPFLIVPDCNNSSLNKQNNADPNKHVFHIV
jgi:hypothetical protein